MDITYKEETLINFLLLFFKNKIVLLRDILTQKTPLSLRLIDWLITNYSKKYNIIYPVYSKKQKIYFNMYLDYKNQLKAYSKKYFDPFCRQRRIIVDTKNLKWDVYKETQELKDEYIITTVGQLNFFRWFIENNVFDYAIENIKLIDLDMTNTMSNKLKNKRSVLSPSALKGIYTNHQSITIEFGN